MTIANYITPAVFPAFLEGVLANMETGPKPFLVADKVISFGSTAALMSPLQAFERPIIPQGFQRVLSDGRTISFSSPQLKRSADDFVQALQYSDIACGKICARYPRDAEKRVLDKVAALNETIGRQETTRGAIFQMIKTGAALAFFGTRFGKMTDIQKAGELFYQSAVSAFGALEGQGRIIAGMCAELASEIMLGFSSAGINDVAGSGADSEKILMCHKIASAVYLDAYREIMQGDLGRSSVNDASKILARSTWHSWLAGDMYRLDAVYEALMMRSEDKALEAASETKRSKWTRRAAACKIRHAWLHSRGREPGDEKWGRIHGLMNEAQTYVASFDPDLSGLVRDLAESAKVFLSGGDSYSTEYSLEIDTSRASAAN